MPDFAALDRTLAETCASGRIAGLVAMVASGSQVLYQGAHGQRQSGGTAAMTPDSLFWIASMTKAITTVAALQLVERGKLALDAPIGNWVPELAQPEVLDGFDSAGNPVLRPARSAISLRQLLTHTSGLSYDMWDGKLKHWLAHTGTPGMASGKLAALKFPLAHQPGTRWAYGTGLDFVGRAVEAATGDNLDDYFRREIFAPLGMTDTGFVIADGQRPRLVAMHRRHPDGALEPIAFETNQKPEFFSGGGGLYSTAPDFIRFVQMILNNGSSGSGQVLAPASVALMQASQIGHLKVEPMNSAIPGLTRNVEFWPGMEKKWSFGFLINQSAIPNGRSAGSLAWAGLGNCYYWIDPSHDVTAIILMQVLPFFDRTCLAALQALEHAVYAARPA